MFENCKTVIIKWSTGSLECIVNMFGGFPLAKLRKLILPYMAAGCTPEDKATILEYLAGEYSAAMEREKISDAKNLYTRITEICTACGLDIPADITEPKENKPDYNYKINYNKLAIVGSIPAPGEDFERCTVPITRKNNNTGLTECYAGDGYGMLINGVPCYAQKVKSNLFIFNCCGASAASIQWKTAAAARDGLKKAFYECLTHSDAVEKLPELYETMRQFMQLPEFSAPEPPAPDPDGSTEDQAPAEEITAAPEDQAPEEPAAPAPEAPAPERPKAKRRAAAPWVGKTMTAYPKKPKKPEWLGRKMVITIGERSARPAGA